MSKWKPKKTLGQNFLQDTTISYQIVEALSISVLQPYTILEIGPGKGALTDFLLKKDLSNLYLVEKDTQLAAYLIKKYPNLKGCLLTEDFLTLDIPKLWSGPIAVIGNFPYNISSPIFFKLLENRNQIQQIVCMVQKEVAERITAQPGNKIYGIPSVLLQAFYKVEYLFTVSPTVFKPVPKVYSAVIRLERNDILQLPCDEKKFYSLVKTAFQQRRKKLRNALSNVNLSPTLLVSPLLDKRAEELSVADFIYLTNQSYT